MKKTYVNHEDFIEVISEIVYDLVVEKFGTAGFVIDEDGDSSYTEEAQDYFNKKYDELSETFNVKWNVYSSAEK